MKEQSVILTGVKDYQNITPQVANRVDSHLAFAQQTVPFYQNLYSKLAGNQLNHQNLYQVPKTTPQDLLEDPYNFVSKKSEPVQISSSGGTYGRRKIIFRTSEDLEKSVTTAEKMFSNSGIVKGDVVAIAQPFDVWNIGHIALDTLKNMGVLCLPVGSLPIDNKTIELIKLLKVNVIYTTPSKAVTIARANKEMEHKLEIKKVLCAGEPITQCQRQIVKEMLGADIFGIYGSEETDGIGSECDQHDGYHIFDSDLLIELLNPETLSPAEKNEGVMAVTKLNNTGTILVRYLLGDKVKIIPEKCLCGVEEGLIIPTGRFKETLFLYNGTKVPVETIEEMLNSVLDKIPQYQIEVTQNNDHDQMKLKIDADLPSNTLKSLEQELEKCGQDLQDEISKKKIMTSFESIKAEKFITNERGKISKVIYINNRDNT